MVDEITPWQLKYIDGSARSGFKSDDCIIRLREELKKNHIISFFRNPDQLAGDVLAAANLVLSKIAKPVQAEPPIVAETSIEFVGEKRVFVGRQDYVNSIIKEKIQHPGSIVSLVGPGGSGKTQLAYRAMRKYVEEERVFDVVVPLYFGSGIASLSLLLSKMAESLGMPIADFEREPDTKKRKQAIIRGLKSRRHPLLYLDNYETISFELNRQLYERGLKPSEEASQIEYFLKNDVPRNASILLTSRETNNRLGETPIALPGLKKDEGKDLFSKLAGPILGPDSLGEMEIQAAVDKVMEVTGGYPLSIELIASNMESISDLKEMTNEIQQRIGQSEVYNPDERLRSLQACFDYTVGRLSEKLRSLLFNLAIFSSPFPIDAPAKILSGGYNNEKSDAMYSENDVERLYNRTLLTRIEADDLYGRVNSKYWLYAFHPATRNYLQDVGGSDPFSLEKEYGPKFYRHYYDLLYNTYNSIGKEGEQRPSLARFSLIYNRGSGSNNDDFDRAIKLAEASGDLLYCANISRAMGQVLKTMGIWTKALEYHLKSLDCNQKLNDNVEVAADYANIGLAYHDMGDYPKALEYFTQALEIHEQLNDRVGLAGDYTNIGLAYYHMGQHPRALEYHTQALEIDEQLNDRSGLAGDYTNIGTVYHEKGQTDKALEFYDKALDKYKQLDDRVNVGNISAIMGDANISLGKHKEALENYNQSLQCYRDLDDKKNMAALHNSMANALLNINEYKEALDNYNKALGIHRELQNAGNDGDNVSDGNDYGYMLVDDYVDIGLTLDHLGNFQQAIEHYDRALRIDPKSAMALDNKGYALYRLGKYGEAIECASMAIDIDNNYANAWYNRSVYYANTDKIDQAIIDLQKAISLVEKYGYDALKDKDFERIKENPRFMALLKRFSGWFQPH